MTARMDDVDLAGQHETMRRDAAINRIVNRPRVSQLLIDNEVCCRDCYEPIDLERLASLPDAVRCVECQQAQETRGGSYGL